MQVLATKLFTPPLRPQLVTRPRLIEKLTLGYEYGFVLVSAPAGYGKSTLLSAWLSQSNAPAAWYSLDEGDNDPAQFLAYLAAALDRIEPDLGKPLREALQTNPLPDFETLLIPLVNRLAQVTHPFWLVLDDVHLIRNEDIYHMLQFLLNQRPPSLCLAIATRADPPLHLSKLRARSQVLELRQADLCFTTQEAAEFVNHTMGVNIAQEDVERIAARTEGWIAGLQMAALSLQTTDDVSGFIAAFAGSHYAIFDFLLEEILDRQTPQIRQFLLYTSILDQLTAPLCAAVMKDPSEPVPTFSSAEIIKELERANLFIIPLDHEHRWYRYHHLFSDLLRLLLEEKNPLLPAELHRRACHWYESQGILSQAIQHAIASKEMQLVEQVISANVLVLIENDELGPTWKKISAIPEDKINSEPWLAIARAWVMGPGSKQILDAAETNLALISDKQERQRLKGHLAAARTCYFSTQGDIPNTVAQAKLAIELLPPNELAVRALVLTWWGDSLNAYRYDPSCLPILQQAMELAYQSKKAHVILSAGGALASAYLNGGKFYALQNVCQEMLAVAEAYQHRNQRPLTAAFEIYALMARLLLEWDQIEKAIDYGRQGRALAERWGIEDHPGGLTYLGRALAYGNNWEEARRCFELEAAAYQRISPWHLQMSCVIALEALLDSQPADNIEVAQYIRRVEESGAQCPLPLKARLLLRNDRPDEVLSLLEPALATLDESTLTGVRMYALLALAYRAKRDDEQALEMLQKALALAEPENIIATFVREGSAMEKLLRFANRKGLSTAFVQRLLSAFDARHEPPALAVPTNDALVEPLTEREIDVLKRLEEGCTDKQIAASLVIASETVHKHLKNIYGKLDVHSRTEALARARKLGLL